MFIKGEILIMPGNLCPEENSLSCCLDGRENYVVLVEKVFLPRAWINLTVFLNDYRHDVI